MNEAKTPFDVTLEVKELDAAVAAVARSASSNSPIAVLGDIRFQVVDVDTLPRLRLTATDTIVTTSCVVPLKAVHGDAQTMSPAMGNAERLAGVVPNLPAGTVRLSQNDNGSRLTISAGEGWSAANVQILGLLSEDFPVVAGLDDRTAVSVPGHELRAAIQHALVSVGATDQHPVQAGVLLAIEDAAKLELSSSDGFRISRMSILVTASDRKDPDCSWSVIAEGRGIRELLRHLSPFSSSVELRCSANSEMIEARTGPVTVLIRTISGTFPSLQQAIDKSSGPANETSRIVISQAALKPALLTATAFAGAGEKSRGVEFMVSDGSSQGNHSERFVTVSASGVEWGESSYAVAATVEGPTLSFMLNPTFVRAALATIESEAAEFSAVSGNRGVFIRPAGDGAMSHGEQLHLLMPMITGQAH